MPGENSGRILVFIRVREKEGKRREEQKRRGRVEEKEYGAGEEAENDGGEVSIVLCFVPGGWARALPPHCYPYSPPPPPSAPFALALSYYYYFLSQYLLFPHSVLC